MKHLFLGKDRRDEWLRLLKAGDPTALSIKEILESHPDNPTGLQKGDPNISQRQNRFLSVQKQSCLAWLGQDANLADRAREELIDLLKDEAGSDLGKAAVSLAAVLTWEFCAELWSPSDQKAFASRLEQIARSFLEIGTGNPHTVTNNWWMLTHGGCLLACIAVDGEERVNGRIDLSDLKAWAFERFKAFCSVFGNAGLYHEGSGYIAYTLSMLMPTLVAVQSHLDPDILDEFPQFRKSIASMLVGTAAFEHTDNGADTARWGASLQWNDAGRGCLGLNPLIPGMVIAPEECKAALRTVFDQLSGIGNSKEVDHYNGLPLLVALYPFSTAPAEPEGILPKSVLDQRQGLGMWRSAWGDGSESVFGWYARSTHAGGHTQDDAASIRLISLGRTWICGGGQARAKAEWQSVFTHADMANRPKPAPLAHLTCNHVHETGGVVAMDTRQSLGAYSERYLSWRTDLDKPFVITIMDLMDEHRDPPLDWQWNLSFPRDLVAEIHDDGAGFSLIDEDRGRLDGRFLIDQPHSLEIREMPATSRTYANGNKVDYPGDCFVHASFPGLKKGRILVAIAISPANSGGQAKISLQNNAIHVDGQTWEFPFSPAILKSVNLAQSAPNRMTLPAG
jgi:hypothetical protein